MFNSKPSFENMSMPSLAPFIKATFFGGLEVLLAATFFLIYSESVDFGGAYLTNLPILGSVFEKIAPDANVSSLICILLSLFSVLVPLFIWSEAFEKVFDQPQEYFSEPQNKLIAGIALFLLLCVISIESAALYSLLSEAAAPSKGGFVTQEPESGAIGWLMAHQSFSIVISLGIALVNLTLSFFCVRTFRTLNSSQG